MSKKLTTEEFIKRAKEIHGDNSFDYLKVDFNGMVKPITIKCKRCGCNMYISQARKHIENKLGCYVCDNSHYKNITKEMFLKKLFYKYPERKNADFSIFEYKGNQIKSFVVCEKGHKFLITPNDLLFGYWCLHCFKEKASNLMSKRMLKSYKASDIENDILEILEDKDRIVKTNEKIKVKCKKCEYIWDVRFSYINKTRSCPKCNNKKATESLKIKDFNYVLEKFYSKFGKDLYDYSESEFIDINTPIKVKCNVCDNYFWVEPVRHYNKTRPYGCPYCSNKYSFGEKKVRVFLDKNNINYIFQYKERINDRLHIFDFYLPDYLIMIEVQGRQHYEPIEFFGGEKELQNRIERDIEKEQYCLDNGIKMLKIPYWEFDNIENTLEQELLLRYM